ncbi:MAG: glycosyltransferase family 2 protein [Patescibacteria group bacterium]
MNPADTVPGTPARSAVKNHADNKVHCSVGILTYNSEKTLRRALESVKDFSDIIICDGGSTDGTLDIARGYNAHIIPQDRVFKDELGRIADFAGVRNQTLDAAKENWFLFIDSDEYISKELEGEIRRIIAKQTEGAFTLFRRYVAGEEEVMCATAYPNRSMRFFARSSADSFIKKVHERIRLKPGVTAENMGGVLYVPVDPAEGINVVKMDYYISLQIEQLKTSNSGFYGTFWTIFWRHARVSLLYLLRLVRIRLFCTGKKMPLTHELGAHVYHARLMIAMWRRRVEFGQNQ